MPKDLFLEVLEVHHEVGVVLFDGGAFFHVAHRGNACGQVPFKHGRHRAFVGVVVLAVNVPARIYGCVDDQVVKASLFAGVEADIPRHGVFDLAPRKGANRSEPSDERQHAETLEGNEGVADHGCVILDSTSEVTQRYRDAQGRPAARAQFVTIPPPAPLPGQTASSRRPPRGRPTACPRPPPGF